MDAARQARTRACAERAWAILDRLGILPTPRNYELFFEYESQDNLLVRGRIDALLSEGACLDQTILDQLYRDLIAQEIDVAILRRGSREIRAIARALIADASEGSAATQAFSEALTICLDALGLDAGAHVSPALAALLRSAQRLLIHTRELEEKLRASAERVAELEEMLAEAERDATTDALTGVANRKLFDAVMRQEIARSVARETTFTLLLIDIDNFKRFNDAHGHKLGDLVLRLVARVLLDTVREQDTVARYGGEEFAIVLPDTGIDAGVQVAERIRNSLQARPIINRKADRSLGAVTISIGAAASASGQTATEVFECADAALYQAKRTGRNRVCRAPTQLERSLLGGHQIRA